MYRVIKYSTKHPEELVFMPLLRDFEVNGKLPSKVGMFIMGTPGVYFNEVKHVEELFTTKNANFSKHEIERSFGAPLLNANIVSLQTEHPLYKKKRKALSGAFFKSRMAAIAQNVKHVALTLFDELQQKGDKNTIDINIFTRQVQANIIVSQLIGHDYCFNHKIPYMNVKTLEVEQRTISGHFENLVEDMMLRLTLNPFISFSTWFNDKEIFACDKAFIHNSRHLRSLL